ncbi:MAG: hypothetical protein K8U03_20460 [Planctomycetia bacterium]|nr:hypothetical protein [Planctomycetia bacterium]
MSESLAEAEADNAADAAALAAAEAPAEADALRAAEAEARALTAAFKFGIGGIAGGKLPSKPAKDFEQTHGTAQPRFQAKNTNLRT